MNFYLKLFSVFFKIGTFTIGGGYAMLPIIKREVVNNHNWLKDEEFIEALAIAQAAPGVLAVNTSVFVGYKLGGLKGVIAASLGAVLPSFFIILIIAIFFQDFQHNPYVIAAFKGIKPAVISLILVPAITLSKKSGVNKKNFFIPILIAILISHFKISPIAFILTGIFGGNIYYRGVKKWFI